MEELRFYSKYLVLAVAILGTIKYKDIKHTKAKYFLFSIWYIVITEFLASNFHDWFNKPNYIIYNIYILLQYAFYLWWFRELLVSVKRRKIVLSFIIIFAIFYLVNAFFFQNALTEIVTYAYAIAVIFMVTTICYFYIEVFNSEVVLRIRSSIYFWFSLGLLLFHATFMPFLFANKFFLFGDATLMRTAQFFLSVLMYTCFAIGFFKAKSSANEHKLS